MVQAQELGQGVQRLHEAPQVEEHHHHHHHHHPQKEPKEESEEEQLVAWDLNLTYFILQRHIILIQWTTFMRQL